MNKTRYSATEFDRNKLMNFRPSGTLTEKAMARSLVKEILSPLQIGAITVILFVEQSILLFNKLSLCPYMVRKPSISVVRT